MKHSILTIVLAVAAFFSVAILFAQGEGAHILWNRQGYAPEQPIAFSHRLHAGELQVACQYCHWAADRSRHAGVPAANVCMNCHRFVAAPLGAIRAEDEVAQEEGRSPSRVVSPEIQKIYDALGLDESLAVDASREPESIRWIKIHRVPEYVKFDHRSHVSVGVACASCHGAVESMERVRQVESLSMGWCVNCHRRLNESGLGGRTVQASIDCVACHY
jgi:Cytochrome c7 and related cytochrome c